MLLSSYSGSCITDVGSACLPNMAAIVLLVLTANSFLVSHGLRMDDNFVTTNTTSGTVRGTVDRAAVPPVIRFLGIPFAKPPKRESIQDFHKICIMKGRTKI